MFHFFDNSESSTSFAAIDFLKVNVHVSLKVATKCSFGGKRI